MHTDDHICMYIRTCIHVHMYSYTYIRTYKRTHVRTYVRTYIHMYTHVHMYSYIHTSVHTHTHLFCTRPSITHKRCYSVCVCREFGYLALVHARSEVGRAARILLTVYGVHRGQGGDRLLAEVHTNTEMDSQWTQEGERWRLISYRGKERPVK